MVTLPTSPEGPTVYLIADRDAAPATRAAVEAGAGCLVDAGCDVVDFDVGPAPTDAERAQVLEFLEDSYNARGAAIPAHAAAFFDTRADTYDTIDDACTALHEVGAIVRRAGALHAYAPRLTAAVRAANRILPPTTTEALIFGAGSDARALAVALSSTMCNARPAKITLASNHAAGLNIARQILTEAIGEGRVEMRHVDSGAENDRLLALLPPGSAVIRAVDGSEPAGASAAGSASLYPSDAVIWDMLSPATASPFLGSAVRQRESSNLTLSDGTAFREESGYALGETLFGADASDAALKELRTALRELGR